MKNSERQSAQVIQHRSESNRSVSNITKAYAPRIALMNSFYRASLHRFVFASAPAGSGKTIGALLWTAECGRKSIWVCLNENDNSSTDFYRQLAFSIASAQPDNPEMDKILKSPSFSSTPIAHVLKLLDAFRTNDEMYAIVFDDIHHINLPVILKSLAAIIKMLPPSFVVLLLSRGEPPEYLRDIIKPAAVIRPEQFLFTEEEVREYFERLGRSISFNEAKVVHASTGGFPISISAVAKTGEIKLGQDNFDIANFLTFQLLNEWSEDIQSFMQKTCVTDEITPELASRLTGCEDSQERLDYLCETNAYITKIGENTYRYHNMFLDLLRSRTGRFEPFVYKTVGDYYLENGALYTALSYYCRSGAFDDIVPDSDKILQYAAPSISVIEQYRNIVRLDIENLSENAGNIRPYYQIWRLWQHYMDGDAKAVYACFDKLSVTGNKHRTIHPVIKNLSIAARYMDIRKSLNEIQNDETAKDWHTEESGKTHIFTLNMLTMNMPFVSRSCRDASEYAADIDNINDTFGGSFHNQLGKHFSLFVSQLKAELYFEKNMLSESEALVSVCIPELWDVADYAFSHCVLRASIAFSAGKTNEVASAFNEIDAYIKDNGYEFLLPNLLAIKTKLMLLDADSEAARKWLELYFVTEPIEDILLYEIFRHFTTARAYMVLGRYRDALALLEKLKQLGTDFARPRDVAEAGVLLSIVKWAEGKKDFAVALLEEALTVLQPFGFIRIVADEGGSVMPVLKRLASKVGRQTYTGALDSSYVNEVSVAANQFAKLHSGLFADAEKNVKVLKLSRRQKQVISLMSKGYKNERIAKELGLDIITVRGHLTNAYRKLGVHTGIEAVFKAREMGIVE